MAGHWSRVECEAIVDDYLDMLAAEIRREPYSKTEHRQILRARLANRSDGSIEYKHQNISAVLIRAGHIYIPRYKPAWNYQELLETVVLDRISDRDTIVQIESILIDQRLPELLVENTALVVVAPPERLPEKLARESRKRPPRKLNYAERESRKRDLGERGESFVLNFGKRRLAEVGRLDLIDDIEWTSKEKGDGTGYDIRSFQDDTDNPLFIEVKTTNSGKYQPFLISANEVSFSNEHAARFALYRVFGFARSPMMFVLDGPVSNHVDLMPTMFRAAY